LAKQQTGEKISPSIACQDIIGKMEKDEENKLVRRGLPEI